MNENEPSDSNRCWLYPAGPRSEGASQPPRLGCQLDRLLASKELNSPPFVLAVGLGAWRELKGRGLVLAVRLGTIRFPLGAKTVTPSDTCLLRWLVRGAIGLYGLETRASSGSLCSGG